MVGHILLCKRAGRRLTADGLEISADAVRAAVRFAVSLTFRLMNLNALKYKFILSENIKKAIRDEWCGRDVINFYITRYRNAAGFMVQYHLWYK